MLSDEDWFNTTDVKVSLLFLVDSKEEKIACQGRLFDANKNCFIKDDDLLYIDAVIQSTDKIFNTAQVKTIKGDVLLSKIKFKTR